MKFADRVAVVTGAASGIGKAAAKLLAAEGAKVVVADINEVGGFETVSDIQAAGGEAVFHGVNTASYDSVKELVESAQHSYGRIDVMFNNAGIGNAQVSLLDLPVEEYHRVVNVNQHGVFYGIKAAGLVMKEQKSGVIINTSSVYGFIADRLQFPYHASKGAVVMMTKAAALELARYNIRVVGIAPGLIDTEIVAGWKNTPEIWDAAVKAQMRRRAGTPEEVAKVVSFLASDDASFVNGHIYFVDDGSVSFKA